MLYSKAHKKTQGDLNSTQKDEINIKISTLSSFLLKFFEIEFFLKLNYLDFSEELIKIQTFLGIKNRN